jgi:transposase, IS5 family
VPDESTIRKVTRRIGAETVSELTRALILKATGEQRFRARAVRIDSTVIEADNHLRDRRRPGVRRRARAGPRGPQARCAERKRRVRDRSRAMGRRLRSISRTIRRRSGAAKSQVLVLTAQTGELLQESVKEARKLAAVASFKARGRGAQAKLGQTPKLEQLADRWEKVVAQIQLRVNEEPITNRLVSLADADATPIPQGQARQAQRVRPRHSVRRGDENTRGAARADPAGTHRAEKPRRERVAARHRRRAPAARAQAARGRPRRWLHARADQQQPGRPGARAGVHLRPQQPGSRRTQRRLQRYRTGSEGRISHLKRAYGLSRSRLKGHDGQRIWTEWSILAYALDTLAVRAA